MSNDTEYYQNLEKSYEGLASAYLIIDGINSGIFPLGLDFECLLDAMRVLNGE